MGLNRIRVDSIKELKKKKTNEQLAEENEKLTAQVATLSDDVTNTQLALCDVYEQLVSVAALTGGDMNG